MKNLILILSVILITGCASLTTTAQSNYGYNDYQNNQNSGYDLSDYLDLEAVASIFAQSRNLSDFENRLNDYRNQVSNLDLNNDGYVDYLRLVKFYDQGSQVILMQAVLGRDYFQDVATIVLGVDRFNKEYVQIIGDSYLYGNDYILEPTYYKRPSIFRWLWSNANHQYVSRYNWGYYPSYYRLRNTLPMYSYYNHLNVIINVQNRYYYPSQMRYYPSYERYNNYRRNDYWRNNSDRTFSQRNQSIKNKGYFQHNENRKEPNVKDRKERNAPTSEVKRRGSTPVIPQRDSKNTDTRTGVPSRDNRVTTPNDNRPAIPSRDSRVTTPSRETQVAPQRNNPVVTPQRDSRVVTPQVERQTVTPQRETRVAPKVERQTVTPQKETKVTPQRESKPAVQREVKSSTPSRVSRGSSNKSTETSSERSTTTRERNSGTSSSGRR